MTRVLEIPKWLNVRSIKNRSRTLFGAERNRFCSEVKFRAAIGLTNAARKTLGLVRTRG